jgi:hypothetical protein
MFYAAGSAVLIKRHIAVRSAWTGSAAPATRAQDRTKLQLPAALRLDQRISTQTALRISTVASDGSNGVDERGRDTGAASATRAGRCLKGGVGGDERRQSPLTDCASHPGRRQEVLLRLLESDCVQKPRRQQSKLVRRRRRRRDTPRSVCLRISMPASLPVAVSG